MYVVFVDYVVKRNFLEHEQKCVIPHVVCERSIIFLYG